MSLINVEHLKAFIWLRTRLRTNQLRKAGTANLLIFIFATILPIVAAIGTTVVAFIVGCFALDGQLPITVMYAYDGALAGFLFIWLITLMADVQRSEGLSIDKLLHLPVSPGGVFLVNYVSSLASPVLAIAAGGFVGLTLGAAFSQGLMMLLVLPAILAFLFAVTAVTYQFQGWLAMLMANPRRRRTIIAALTGGVILVAQTPQLFTLMGLWGKPTDLTKLTAELNEENQAFAVAQVAEGEKFNASMKTLGENQNANQAAANADLAAGKLTKDGYKAKLDALGKDYKAKLDALGKEQTVKLDQLRGEYLAKQDKLYKDDSARTKEQKRLRAEEIEGIAGIANFVLPFAWPALAARGASDGNVAAVLLVPLAFTALGALSLRRAYRTTMRHYTGFASGGPATAPQAVAAPIGPRKLTMAEWQLPWIDEQSAGVAAAGLRSLIRAPESKMMLFAPIFFVVVFGSLIASLPLKAPELVRPLVAGFGIGIVLLAGFQLVGNQFGYDRGGFRAYVLAPVPRRAILFGKNLAAAPLVLGACLTIVVMVGVFLPMRFDHWLALLPQAASMYLIFCCVANALSILSPLPIAPGSMQPSSVRFVQVLAQLLAGSLLPVLTAPTFLPIAAEALLTEATEWGGVLPISLVLSLVLFFIVALIYARVLTWEGRLLAKRERELLLVVTSKEE